MMLPTTQRVVFTLLLVASSVLTIYSQQPKPNPQEQPRKIKPEPKRAYVNWIKDVDLILTESERQAWPKLKTDDEREQFITLFWKLRDPDPDTEENEFKEQYYERLAYADEHFTSGK